MNTRQKRRARRVKTVANPVCHYSALTTTCILLIKARLRQEL